MTVVLAFEKSFQQIWRELTKKGWTYRRSTGLRNAQRYLPPNGNLKGTEGIDFFVAEASTESMPCLQEGVALQLPEAPEAVVDSPHHAVTEDPVGVTSATELAVTDNSAPSTEDVVTEEGVNQVGARLSTTAVSQDDFDSDEFLDALKRDQLFASTEPDDLDTDDADWLLELNSDAEGDEESILLDEDEIDTDDNGAPAPRESRSDDEPEEGEGLDVDELPVEFELTDEELDQLQADGWDTFDEQHAAQVLLGPMPLYDGPSGPTRAALAYAESPLAIFYFFLPKDLWRMIAKETNRYRTDSIDEVAQGMRARARARRLKSTAGRRTSTRMLLHNVLWSRIFFTCSEVSLLSV
ncbi:uncharacterized protein IUM83_06543 [Phytophthora cinnamomi]|uniref:uncharacterized protein n=1 Tax=Phytophthora cinnamomi TaxID=4785 RepID=UPI0035596E4A|nr:hypothetical protein IUM83_06543 [Phytophthora cinnamomi]